MKDVIDNVCPIGRAIAALDEQAVEALRQENRDDGSNVIEAKAAEALETESNRDGWRIQTRLNPLKHSQTSQAET
ncbi:MAG: hypothetical protein AAFR42_00025 [Cyanobacteria bacterium J06628_6]